VQGVLEQKLQGFLNICDSTGFVFLGGGRHPSHHDVTDVTGPGVPSHHLRFYDFIMMTGSVTGSPKPLEVSTRIAPESLSRSRSGSHSRALSLSRLFICKACHRASSRLVACPTWLLLSSSFGLPFRLCLSVSHAAGAALSFSHHDDPLFLPGPSTPRLLTHTLPQTFVPLLSAVTRCARMGRPPGRRGILGQGPRGGGPGRPLFWRTPVSPGRGLAR